MLSTEALNEFKKIIFEDYGVSLSDEQAHQDAVAFLGAFELLASNDSLILNASVDGVRKDCA